MLRRKLPPHAGRHADDDWHGKLPARHVAQRRRGVHDLVDRQQAEVDGHDLDDRPHAAERRADASADERGLRKWRIADALFTEFVEQALADCEAAAVPADVLAHQEDARVRCSASRMPCFVASR